MKVKKDKTKKEAKPQIKKVTKDKEELPAKPAKSVDASIFQYFTDLTNDDENVRLSAGVNLLQYLAKTQDKDKREKEHAYTLRRLIRGTGASTTASRSGFFSALVAFLQTSGNDVTVQQVLDTMQKELNVGASVTNKEDANGVVGKILVCAALLRSGKLKEINSEHLEQITNILIQSGRHRTYHSSLAYNFIIDLIEQLTDKQFEESVWPLLLKELAKPWAKQTVQTVHCLIALLKKFPSILNGKFMKSHFGGSQLLNSESQAHLVKLFWGNPNSDILTHPALEAFGLYLAKCSGLDDFWENHVDEGLANPNKLQQIISLKITTDVLINLDNEKTPVSQLLTPNFIKMIVGSLKNAKTKKDETLTAFYDEFFESLCAASSKATDEQRVKVIQRLILHPGTFNIEKFTKTRVVHQLIGFLGESGVQEIFKTYKEIFLNRLPKNSENASETWLNFERQNAVYILQNLLSHKSVQNSFAWRQEQLEFFMTLGLFNINDSGEICSRNEVGDLQKNFGTHMKNIFYASLQSKVAALKNEKSILVSLATKCNEYLQKKNPAKYFRQKIDDKILKAWNDMYKELQCKKKLSGNEKKLQLVFHILLGHMGFQLFREREMAETAISDLEKCMEMTKGKQDKVNGKAESEPEWIEVVIDLFLHLLSQNASALRNIVNTVFPHLCGSLNLTTMHQILSMLDMKDGQNPLTSKGEDEADDEEDEEEEEDDEKADDASEAEDEEDDEESGSDEDEDDDDVENEDEDDADITESDKLRNAVSLALGAALPKDDDQDSIDLNDMTEEEGKKLDEALANAFKAMKKTGGSNKKSKNHRVQMTTVMHFRIRVLDLIEIYIQHEPSLLITIEVMLALFNMLEFCADDELKPLLVKVEKILTKLTALRQFGSVQDVTEGNLVDFIRLIIEKKSRPIVFDVQNRLKNKCCMFLIANAKLMSAGGTNDQVLSLITEYLEDFIKSRNPAVNITLLSDIFKLRWVGVWSLAATLTEKGIAESTRTFRRIQVIELLTSVYTNHELIKQDEAASKKHFKRIEPIIARHIGVLEKAASVSVKEFNKLLELFFTANRCHTKFSIQNSTLSTCTEQIQKIRSRVKLESAQSYHRFCNAYGVKPVKNTAPQANGKQNGHVLEDEEEDGGQSAENGKQNGKKRKATKTSDLKKEKKQKKLDRMNAFSEGLNGGFTFDDSTAGDVVMSDGPANEDEEESSGSDSD